MKVLVITGLPSCYEDGIRVAVHKDNESEADICTSTCCEMNIPYRKTLRGMISALKRDDPRCHSAKAWIEECGL